MKKNRYVYELIFLYANIVCSNIDLTFQKQIPSSSLPPPSDEAQDDIKGDESSDLSNDTPLSELAKEVKSKNELAAKEAEVIREEPDTFESDSNEDKSLESIKREIQGLSELKENSSESSCETPEPKVDEPAPPTIEPEECEPATAEPEEITDPEPEAKNESEGEDISDVAMAEEPTPVDEEMAEKPVEEEPQQPDVEPENIEEKVDTAEQIVKEEVEQIDEELPDDKESPDSVEIVEIKDDRSEDDNKESIILIEEADESNSKEIEETEPKTEYDFTFKLDDTDDVEIVLDPPAIPEENIPSVPDHRSSSDEEVFEDAKENIEDIKHEDDDTNAESEVAQNTISLIDTDDDSPIEVIKEDKAGRTKRDYSRKKHESTPSTEKRYDDATSSEEISNISTRMKLKDRDRSESPYCDDESGEPKSKRRYSSTPIIDSLPNSPASSDDREYRSWKKSILIVYSRLISHKNASLFAKPISDEQVPDYKDIVYHPSDLQSLKRNIENGSIRSTPEFQRYVMIMCYNALLYNLNDEVICARAKEMLNDALTLIDDIMDTWRKESEKSASSSGSSATKMVRGRKSNRLLA